MFSKLKKNQPGAQVQSRNVGFIVLTNKNLLLFEVRKK